MLFIATVSGASDKIYQTGDYEIKNEILYEVGTDIGLNGILKLSYPSGALKAEDNYIDGKLNGVAKLYYESGALRSERNYINSKLNGVRKTLLRIRSIEV